MRRLAVVVVVFAAAALSARAAGPLILPTIPGAYNAAVKQTTIHKTVCITGWTRTIRPPLSYTAALKKKQVVSTTATRAAQPRLARTLIFARRSTTPTAARPISSSIGSRFSGRRTRYAHG